MPEFAVKLNSNAMVIGLGENTILAGRERVLAEDARADAAESAAFAEEFSGPAYASQAAGEAATTSGQFFRVPIGTSPETYTRYQRTEDGSVIAAPLASTADLASPDKGATLINFEPYGNKYTGAGDEPSPWSVYFATGDPGRTARQIHAPANRGEHIGEQFSGLGIPLRPTGSGSNGPDHADIGLNISVIKDGTAVGEIDGLNVTVRQAGAASDACAILTDIAGWNDGTGFWGQYEGSTKHMTMGGTVFKDIRIQLGVIDTELNSSFGLYATADAGVIGTGLLFNTNPGKGSFVNHIRAHVLGRTAFQVDGQGRTYVNAGDLDTSQASRQECYILEAATGNSISGHIEFNRHTAGSDWTSSELRIRGSVDNSEAAASSPWMALRGTSAGVAQITFGFGVAGFAFDRVTIPIGGGINILDLPAFNFANDAAAAAGGVGLGGLYHTDGPVKVRRT